MTEPIATSLSLNGQNKTIRTLSTTTVGAVAQVGEPTSHFTGNSIPVASTKWFEYAAPADAPGIFRMSFQRVLDQPDADFAWAEFLQYGSGFDGLGLLDWVPGDIYDPPDGLVVNCEGYQAHHESSAFERALAPGEHHYVQITTYDRFAEVNVGIELVVQWYFEPLPQPYEITATPSIKQCPGMPNPTGFGDEAGEIRYYLTDNGGWPAKFLPGKSIPHSPDLPVDGHAFYVEEWIEATSVQYRGFIVGWTEESGPWFYSHLNPDSSMRTWDVETVAASGVGACGPDGIHHVPYFADRAVPPGVDDGFGYQLDSFHSAVGEGETPTTNWGDLTGARSLTWGGPARSDRFFADFGTFVREFDLDGNEVRDISGLPIIPLWCGPDGHTMFAFTPNFGFGGGDLYSFDLDDDALSLVASAVFIGSNFPRIFGIRPNGEIVVSRIFPSDVALVDSATGSVRTFTLPSQPYTAYFGSTFVEWSYLGITSDSKHLFLGAFGPLDIMPFGTRYVGRRFVSDIYWIDLDTGAVEFKFRMGHPFHDTGGIVDTINTPQTTIPVDVNIRLKPTISKVLQTAVQGVTEMTPR